MFIPRLQSMVSLSLFGKLPCGQNIANGQTENYRENKNAFRVGHGNVQNSKLFEGLVIMNKKKQEKSKHITHRISLDLLFSSLDFLFSSLLFILSPLLFVLSLVFHLLSCLFSLSLCLSVSLCLSLSLSVSLCLSLSPCVVVSCVL